MGSKWGVFSWVMLQGATTKLRYAFPYPKISNTRVPIKIAFFVWLIHHGAIQHKTARVPGAILTQDNLVKGVWISVNWWIFCSKKKLKPSVTCLCTAPLLCSLVRLTCFLLGCWLSFQSPWSLLYCIFFFFFFFCYNFLCCIDQNKKVLWGYKSWGFGLALRSCTYSVIIYSPYMFLNFLLCWSSMSMKWCKVEVWKYNLCSTTIKTRILVSDLMRRIWVAPSFALFHLTILALCELPVYILFSLYTVVHE